MAKRRLLFFFVRYRGGWTCIGNRSWPLLMGEKKINDTLTGIWEHGNRREDWKGTNQGFTTDDDS